MIGIIDRAIGVEKKLKEKEEMTVELRKGLKAKVVRAPKIFVCVSIFSILF